MNKKKLNLRSRKVVIGASGRAEEVILSIEDYEELLELIEDLEDLAHVEAMTDEEKEAIPWEQAIKDLKNDGIL